MLRPDKQETDCRTYHQLEVFLWQNGNLFRP